MPRSRARTAVTVTVAAALTAVTAACGGGSSTDGGGSNDNPEDTHLLGQQPGREPRGTTSRSSARSSSKFEKQTGIKVKLEVVPWSDLLNRILAATTSGQGPDVLNIGNTWSASLQATGALLPWDDETLRRDRRQGPLRCPPPSAATGAAGKDPAAVPLYSLAYAPLLQQEDVRRRGHRRTAGHLGRAGRRRQEAVTGDGKWGLALEGGNLVGELHHAFVLGKQHGADFFDSPGKPHFDPRRRGRGRQAVRRPDGQRQDRRARATPSTPRTSPSATSPPARRPCCCGRPRPTSFKSQRHEVRRRTASRPVPVQAGTPGAGASRSTSMVAGINLAVFKNTDNIDGAHEVREVHDQRRGADASSTRPTARSRRSRPPRRDPAFDTPDLKVLRDMLASSAAPLPQVPDESQFETLVGTAIEGAVRRRGSRTAGDRRSRCKASCRQGAAADAQMSAPSMTSLTASRHVDAPRACRDRPARSAYEPAGAASSPTGCAAAALPYLLLLPALLLELLIHLVPMVDRHRDELQGAHPVLHPRLGRRALGGPRQLPDRRRLRTRRSARRCSHSFCDHRRVHRAVRRLCLAARLSTAAILHAGDLPRPGPAAGAVPRPRTRCPSTPPSSPGPSCSSATTAWSTTSSTTSWASPTSRAVLADRRQQLLRAARRVGVEGLAVRLPHPDGRRCRTSPGSCTRPPRSTARASGSRSAGSRCRRCARSTRCWCWCCSCGRSTTSTRRTCCSASRRRRRPT